MGDMFIGDAWRDHDPESGSLGLVVRPIFGSSSIAPTYDAFVSGAIDNLGAGLSASLAAISGALHDIDVTVELDDTAIVAAINSASAVLSGAIADLDIDVTLDDAAILASLGALSGAIDVTKATLSGALADVDNDLVFWSMAISASIDFLRQDVAKDVTLQSVSASLSGAIDHVAKNQTNGTQSSIVRGGTKGATTPADVTSTVEGVDHQALDVQIYHGGTAKDPTQIRSLISGSDSVTIREMKASGSAHTAPSRSTTSATILAANSNREGATVYNDSGAKLYLLLGPGTASSSNFTITMDAQGYYEVPFKYSGIIVGAWASNGTGTAQVTEFTP